MELLNPPLDVLVHIIRFLLGQPNPTDNVNFAFFEDCNRSPYSPFRLSVRAFGESVSPQGMLHRVKSKWSSAKLAAEVTHHLLMWE